MTNSTRSLRKSAKALRPPQFEPRLPQAEVQSPKSKAKEFPLTLASPAERRPRIGREKIFARPFAQSPFGEFRKLGARVTKVPCWFDCRVKTISRRTRALAKIPSV